MAEQQPSADSQQQEQPPGTVAISMTYAKSHRGILKIVEFFLLLITFSSSASCCGTFSFFLFATIASWIFVTLIFLAYFFCLVEKIPQINWTVTVFINSIIWCVLVLIASSLLADYTRRRAYYFYLPGSLYAAVVFGFFSVFAFALDIVVHAQLLQSG